MCVPLSAVQLDQEVWRSQLLHDVLVPETQLTHLALGDDREAICMGNTSLALEGFSRLAALRHLDVRMMWQPTPGDCRAVAQLQHLTTLELPTCEDRRVSPLPTHLVSTCTLCPPAEMLLTACLLSAHVLQTPLRELK